MLRDVIASGDEIANLNGEKDAVLSMERTILNILGQLSGIATEAKKWASKAPGQIACTRKTICGLMYKWAVHLGGGLTHRLNKSDAKSSVSGKLLVELVLVFLIVSKFSP